MVYTEWIFFGALAIGLLRLRRTPGYAPAFRAAGGAGRAALSSRPSALAIVVHQIAADPRESLIGLALVAAGLPVYYLLDMQRSRGRCPSLTSTTTTTRRATWRRCSRAESSVKVTVDGDGNPLLHYPGDYNIAVRGHRDIAYREEVLAEHGVDTQVLTLTTPGTHVETGRPCDSRRW